MLRYHTIIDFNSNSVFFSIYPTPAILIFSQFQQIKYQSIFIFGQFLISPSPAYVPLKSKKITPCNNFIKVYNNIVD